MGRIIAPDVTVVLVDDSGEHQGEGVVCRHCGTAHIPEAAIQALVTGAADKMGFCFKCNGPVCAECSECRPQEQQIDNIEAGRHPLAERPAFAAFARNPLILPR
jgi:hypothetical protein